MNYEFNVAKCLGPDEQVTYEDLSQRCKISTSDLRRFLRLAIANHIFLEPQQNVVARSTMSRIMAEMPVSNDWIGFVCEEMWPASTRCIEAMKKWPGSEALTHTGFAMSGGVEGNFFEEIGQYLERASGFATAITVIQSAPPFDLPFLVGNLDWTEPGCPRSIVDIGGSNGSVSMELL